MHTLDFIAVGAYLAFTVGLGIYFGRHQSRKEFFAASNSMGWLPVGLSVMATLFSSNSFVFYPSAAFEGNLRIGLSLVAFTLMTPVIVFVFIPVFTRLKCQTAYEYLELRFHVSVRCLASGLFILLRIGWMASATYAASLVVANVAGIPQTTVIFTLGAVAIAYTMIGGLRAVMWTDVIQFAVFAATIVIALVLVVINSGIGVGGIAREYFDGREGIFFDFEPSLTLSYGSWVILIGIFLESVAAFGSDQVAVQRYLAARSERTAKIGSWLNLAGMWLVVPGLLAIGVGLYAYFENQPNELLPLIDESQRAGLAVDEITREVRAEGHSDKAMPQFVSLHFPPGMTGLFLAALMAAIMSSIDSGIHSVTTALVVDFRDRLKPEWKPADDKRDVRLIRFLVVIIGVIAVTLACFVGGLGNVFAIGKKMTSAFGAPLLAVFVLALFFKHARTAGVFVGALLSAGITLGLMFCFEDWFAVWYWPIGFFLTLLIAIPLSATGRPPAEAPLTFSRVIRQSRNQP